MTLGKTVYVLGGRVPNPPATPPIPGDSTLLNDVWASKDRGKKWKQLVATGSPKMWSPRAYFASVAQGKYMYVLGGQDYRVVPNPCPPPPIAPDCPPLVSTSAFFNDVWRSKDGKRWQKMTGEAGWAGRAGLSAVSLKGDLYVFAASGGRRCASTSTMSGVPGTMAAPGRSSPGPRRGPSGPVRPRSSKAVTCTCSVARSGSPASNRAASRPTSTTSGVPRTASPGSA